MDLNLGGFVQCESGQSWAQYVWERLEFSKTRVEICFLVL